MGKLRNNKRRTNSVPNSSTNVNVANASQSSKDSSISATAANASNIASDAQNSIATTSPTDASSSTNATSGETGHITDIYEKIKSTVFDHKEVFASAIVILGILLYSFGYTYYQGFFEYFGVSEKWITSQQSSFLYSLILPLSGIILLMFPNLIASFPLIAKAPPIKIAVFEVSWLIDVFCVLYCYNMNINIIHSSWIAIVPLVFLIIFVIFIAEEKHGLIETILGIIILLTSAAFLIWIIIEIKKDISVGIQHIIDLVFITFFITGIPIIIWIFRQKKSSGSQNNSQNTPQNPNTTTSSDNKIQKIKDRNISIIGYLIVCIFLFPICFLLFNSIGKTSAMQKRDYNIIQISEDELYDTDSSGSFRNELILSYNEDLNNNNEDIIIETIKDKPYLKIVKIDNNEKCVRRIVNAYVVISENDDNYLVINAYIDTNTDNLYIFKSEKKEIEKNGQLIKTIILDDKPIIV